MAFLECKNVRIAGMSVGVPKNTINNQDGGGNFSTDYSPEDFIATTGVRERRFSMNLTTSDLCYKAAETLIADLHWDKNEVEALIFVSQTADYILPATSCILQDRLGLSKECYTEDISLGCSGWVYGLSNIASLIANGNVKKAILLAGDAKPRVFDNDPLFGHAGTATALEYEEGNEGFKFHFGTDGSGYDAIIIPDGGSRNGISLSSFETTEIEGRIYSRLHDRMKGMDVFGFGISTAPKSIKKLSDHFCIDYMNADYYVFHQANMKMINMIAKKLKLPLEKVPSSMNHFGNTSSASIPVTIVSQLRNIVSAQKAKMICCGFGVGLSWGSVAFETNKIVVPEIVEISDQEGGAKWV